MGGKSIRDSINDNDREEWVNNDAGLYAEYRASRQGMRAFVRSHRAEIDEVIRAVIDAEPAPRDWRYYTRGG